MVTIEDANGVYTAETMAEARKLKAARGRAVKKANERYEEARARAERTAYLILTRVLGNGSSPFVIVDRASDAGRHLAALQDAPDGEPCDTMTGAAALHMIADADGLPGGCRAKLRHRGLALSDLIVDGGGVVRAVLLDDKGAELVYAVAAYEDADGHYQFATAHCPLVGHYHFVDERRERTPTYDLAAEVRGAVEQADRAARARLLARAK